eukprot:2697957-Prymnesium_polylepis.1
MALHIAASMGHTRFVQLLLVAGVDATVVEQGVTALHSAAFQNKPDVVAVLLGAGADPDAAQSDGSTALLEASAAGHVAV